MVKNKGYERIDLKIAFQKKSPKTARWIPGFIFSYLRRIIHEDEINDFLSHHGHEEGIVFSDSILERLSAKYDVIGAENIPESGRFIFASNHPLGGPDGIMLISFFGKMYSSIKFPVNDILLNIHNFNKIFVPVNKHGAQGRRNAKLIDDAYESDAQVLMFPAGFVSRKKKGVIKDLMWKKNFITKAIEHKRDVVPIHTSGRNSNFFYNLANFREALGINANIEMLYLSNELFKQIGKTFTIHIGKPISYQRFDKSKSRQEWAAFVKDKAYELAI